MNDFIVLVKQKFIDEYLERLRVSEKYTDKQLYDFKGYLESKVFEKEMLTLKVNDYGKTNSMNVNKTSENLFYDIYTIYKSSDELTRIIDEYISVSLATINNVNLKLDSCIDMLNNFVEELKTKGNPKIVTENFISNNAFENDLSLYRERYGEYTNLNNHCDIDVRSRHITLPLLLKSNTLMYDNGVCAGTISIRKKSGEGFLNVNTPTKIDNISDTSFNSFWKNTTLSNSPITIKYSDIKPETSKELSDFYYGIKHGLVLELEINFESVCVINNLEITPFTKYPMELVAIRYSDTDDYEYDLKELVYPDNENEKLRNKILHNTISYNFSDITCKRMFLIFNQINFEKRNFIINTSEIVKNEIVLNSDRSEDKVVSFKESNLIFKPNYLDRTNSPIYLSSINKISVFPKDINFFDLFDETTTKFKKVLKNCYECGFYNISTHYMNYNHSGVYVSSPITVDRNIESVSIITDEYHELSSDGKIDTDIEYYIAYADQPNYNDWYSILPKNIDYIHSELLQLGTDMCLLRFPAKQLHSIYMNEILLTENVDYITHYDGDYITMIEIPNFNHRAIYKASYTPVDSARELTFLGANRLPVTTSCTESIDCCNESYYELKNVAYVDSENSTYVRIVNRESGYVAYQEGVNIYCCTDPYESDKSYKNFFDSEKLQYQYYTSGNKIIFNKAIPSEYKVEITYKHYVHRFRLKAIIRRNNYKDVWLTPILSKIEYTIGVL